MNANQNMIAHWRARQSATILDNQTGTILSWTKVYVAPEPFELQVPYVLALIAIDSGQRILCSVADADEADMFIGAHVQFVTRVINCPHANAVITYGIKAVLVKRAE